MRSFSRIALILPVLAFAVPPLRAEVCETGALLIHSFKPRDYHGSPVAARVLQHPLTGSMLLLAGSMLHEFDGTAWESLETNIPALRSLGVDAAGRVWLGGVDQLGYCARGPDGAWRFQPLADRVPAADRKFGRVWDTVVAPDAVWFATETKVLRWQNEAFTIWNFPSTGTLIGAGGQIFFQLKNSSLQRWDGTAFRVVSRDPLVGGPTVTRLFPTQDGAIEGVNSAGAFFRIRGEVVEPFAPEFKTTLGKNRVICALPRPHGGWYVGTDSGLLVIDTEGRLARRLGKAEGLADSAIMDLTWDRDGALWVATFSGPFQIEQPEAVSLFGEAEGVPTGLSHGLLRHDGQLYLSATTGVLQLAPGPRDGLATFRPVPGSPRYPQQLLSHASGLLVANSSGLWRLAHGRLERIVETENSMVSLAPSRRDPSLLFVGQSAGAVVYSLATETPRELQRFPDIGQVRTVHEDDDGSVWLATSTRGLLRLQPAPGPEPWGHAQATVYDSARGKLPAGGDSTVGLTSPFGLTFSATTAAGEVRYDAATDRFVRDDRITFHGHPVGLLNITAASTHGDAWISASFEEYKDAPLFGRIARQSSTHGDFAPAAPSVQEILGPIGAIQIFAEGEGSGEVVWIAHPEGVARVRRSALTAPAIAWRTQLTRFVAQGVAQPLAPRAPTSYRYSRRPYTFAFHAPRLESGADVEYQTKLVGWDTEWSAFKPAREVTFTALTAGHYQFLVRARDSLHRTSEQALLAFSVTPPWHLTPLAFVFYAVALASSIFCYIRWRLSRAERERLRLENLVEVRTRDLAIARDAAESASRAKSAFLASMSHELRTPLNGVLGYAQLLQADKRLAPDQQERLRIVHQSGEHLLHMINDVLDLAKIEAGKLTLRPAPFALVDLLRDIAAAHDHAAAAKNLSFTTETAPDLPAWVEADAQKLRQILDNLLGNAIKFTAKGSITLRVCRAGSPDPADAQLSTLGSPLHFSVADTGPGISTADQQRLFQAFEQAEPTHTTTTGTGLGLAISRALVERFGGTLTLDSAPGRGSTFAFTLALPSVAPGLAATTAGRRIVGHDGNPRRALIVDDHAINRRLLGELLAPLGFECADYASPADTLARLTSGAEPWPDVAILDLRMPEIDGLELTRRLRRLPRGAELKILLTSASVIAFDPADATRAGCDDFLPKPFRTADLLEKLGRLLALTWRESDSAPPFPGASAASAGAPLPDSARATLRELLATGDLEAFTAELVRQRTAHPTAAVSLDALATAAAAFQLSRLRQLLE